VTFHLTEQEGEEMAKSLRQVLRAEEHDLKVEGNALLDKGEVRTDEENARLDAISARLTELIPLIAHEDALADAMRVATYSPAITGMHNLREDKPWASLGEFLSAVGRAGMPGGPIDVRLLAASGAQSGVPSEGGFLVGVDYTTRLLDLAQQAAQLWPLCDNIPIGPNSDGIEAPYIAETSRANGYRWGGVLVYRRSEAGTVTATKPTFGQFDLRLEDLMGLAYATERLLRDATALDAIFTRAFASEFAFKMDDELIRGTGAGECLGLLNAPALVSIDAETGQAAATIVTQNISRMWAAMPARLRGGAVWIYNQDCEPQLDELAIPVGTGALEPRFVTYGPDGILRIKGRPALAIEQCETLGTVGDFMLVNWGQYAVITKGGIEAQQSIHVKFEYNERAFRWVTSNNGAPKWKTYLTPYKGSNYQSPYVALATRS